MDGSALLATTIITDSILSNTSGGFDLVNTVVNGNHPNSATVTLSGPNLVMSSSGTISGTTPLNSDPRLGPLQNNGGPTPTMAQLPGSPAINVGVPVDGVTADQQECR